MRRRRLFAIAAVLAAAMYPISDRQFHWVVFTVSGVYVVLYLLSVLESVSERRRR